ncbi:MAG: hypothetical protein CYPHOPRED_002330 [Cyphobasidiales sp. Tagirdzhanova-0007]|nr:MAG: hypothetical protein CYPHOPRED_002330 [Cyphobasidiales sp. Tagirdzhanova-0007]
MQTPEGSGSRASSLAEQTEQEQQQKRPLLYKKKTHLAGEAQTPDAFGYGSFLKTLNNAVPKSGASTPKFTSAPKKRALRTKNKSYWSYYVPIFNWLPTYSSKVLIGDVVTGLTLTCLLVPQSMSYASGLAHLDPVNGLFGVIVPAFLYALFGNCGQLSVGPEAALSLLIGQTIDKLLSSKAHLPATQISAMQEGIASVIVFEVGLITFLLGIFRLGFLDAVLSRALLRGFITAVGFVIFIEQLTVPLLGLGAIAKARQFGQMHPVEKLVFVIQNFRSTHRLTASISLASLAILISVRIAKPRISKTLKWVQYVPEILMVVVIATILTAKLEWDTKGVGILGKVSAGAVHLHFPIHSSKMTRYAISSDVLSSAVTIAIMGYVDTIVAAKQNASSFNYAISPNRELTAIGIANLGASIVSGTVPGYGSITRSRLAASAGARTPMASFFVALFTLLATFFLLRYLYYLPKAVLACIISLVVYSILAESPEDVAFFIGLRAWTDLALMATAFFMTLFFSVQTGIVVSVAFSLVLVVRQAARSMGVQIMGRIPGTEQWAPVEDIQDDDYLASTEEVPGVLIVRLRETLHFANAGALKERLRRLERYGVKKMHPSDAPVREEAQIIVLYTKDLLGVDASALQILHETCRNYVQRGVQVHFVHVEGELRRSLERAHLFTLIGRDHVHATVKECLDLIKASAPPSFEHV